MAAIESNRSLTSERVPQYTWVQDVVIFQQPNLHAAARMEHT
jgi:hypothetical protein